jgi:hypothetical protein
LCSSLGRLSFPSLPTAHYPLPAGIVHLISRVSRQCRPLLHTKCSSATSSTRTTHRRHLHLCCTLPAPEPVFSQQETGHP